jgi:hypothetical protein
VDSVQGLEGILDSNFNTIKGKFIFPSGKEFPILEKKMPSNLPSENKADIIRYIAVTHCVVLRSNAKDVRPCVVQVAEKSV